MYISYLGFDPEAYRGTVGHRKIFSVHAVGQDGLRMKGIVHIDAVYPAIERMKVYKTDAISGAPGAIRFYFLPTTGR
jgi:hypothetical protein